MAHGRELPPGRRWQPWRSSRTCPAAAAAAAVRA